LIDDFENNLGLLDIELLLRLLLGLLFVLGCAVYSTFAFVLVVLLFL